MTTVNTLRKLTVAAMGFDTKALAQSMKDGEVRELAALYGRASGYKLEQNKFDPTRQDARFIGSFEGVNLATGEVFVAGGMYLPGAAQEMVQAAVDGKGDADSVEFGFKLSIRKDPKVAIGFTYKVETARAPETADALSAVRQSLGVASIVAKALPAPEVADASTEKKEKPAKK